MSKTVNNFYVTVNGDLEEVHDLILEVARLEDERDNAILERDEAVAKASDLAQELADSQALVKFLDRGREEDWKKLKSWNKVANEKAEEARKERLLADDWKAQYSRLNHEIAAKNKQIEDLRNECANKRLQIKGLQAELDEADRERNAWKTRALERQERVEGLQTELIEAQNELDAIRQSGEYFADRTDALTQQVKDLQDQLDEAKKFARSWQDMYNNLEIQRSLAEHSATYWHDKYYGTTS